MFVRWGKSSKGSPPKRRTIFTVPEMDWIVEDLDHYLTEVRPRFGVGKRPAIWVTERSGRLSRRSANEAFEAAKQAAGLLEELELGASEINWLLPGLCVVDVVWGVLRS